MTLYGSRWRQWMEPRFLMDVVLENGDTCDIGQYVVIRELAGTDEVAKTGGIGRVEEILTRKGTLRDFMTQADSVLVRTVTVDNSETTSYGMPKLTLEPPAWKLVDWKVSAL